MIRPYFTVVADSFHEAFCSRVLWILLAVATVVLGAIVPTGLSERRESMFRAASVGDWPGLLTRIHQGSQSESPSPARQVWQAADKDFRHAIDDCLRGNAPPEVSRESALRLLDGANRLLASRELYDADTWAGVVLERESKRLLDRGVASLSDDDLLFVNRQLLKAAFPVEIAGTPSKELHLTYAHWTVGSPLPITRGMAEPAIRLIVARVMDFFVGSVAVFIAILITAPMIPQAFEPGAIDLLLSKPVARPLLFLAKFFGGCAFILLVGGYFIAGLWLVLGTRFGLWMPRLWMCLPVFLFLFVVYYSVSALAGVFWRNATVSIVVTILFWAACFGTGAAKGIVEQFFINPAKITTLVASEDAVVAVNSSGDFLQWQGGAWQRVLSADLGKGPRPRGGSRLIGPVCNKQTGQLAWLVVAQPHGIDFFRPAVRLMTADWADGSWKRGNGPTPPAGASWLFYDAKGRPVVLGVGGIFRLDAQTQGTTVLGFTLPFGSGGSFAAVGPKQPLDLSGDWTAAMQQSGDLAIWHGGELTVLKAGGDGAYEVVAHRPIETLSQIVAIGFSGASLVAAQADGGVLLIDAKDLAVRDEFFVGKNAQPRIVQSSGDGRWFCVLCHDGRLAILDAQRSEMRTLRGDFSAVAFDAQDRLLAADNTARVTRYLPESLEIVDRCEPPLDILQAVHRYFLVPFYTVFPKPGELGSVVSYLISGDDNPLAQLDPTDPRQPRVVRDIRGPIFSSLAFAVVMLGIACLYVSRADL